MPKQSHIWFKTDGSYGQVNLDHKLSLKEMQGLVRGYIERVRVMYHGEARDMWVNEEGLIHNLPPNLKASSIAGQPIVGDVFIIL